MDLAGTIFMCNRETQKECFKRKLFGLPMSQSSLVKELKTGMMLFLFEYEKRELYGVYEATSDGGFNIEPNAFTSSGKAFGAQIRFKTLWFCHPLSEPDFCDAIKDNYYTPKKFKFSLSLDQVKDLLRLFSSRQIKPKLLKRTGIDDGAYRLSDCRVNLNNTDKQEGSLQPEQLKSTEIGGVYRQFDCRMNSNDFQSELLKSREIGNGAYRQFDCRMNTNNGISRQDKSFVRHLSNARPVIGESTCCQEQVMPSKLPSYEPRLSHSALSSLHRSGSVKGNFQGQIAHGLHENYNRPKTVSDPEEDNPPFSATRHSLNVVHPYSRSHFYEPSAGHISVQTNSRCTDNSGHTCFDDYIPLPLSEQRDPAISETGFLGPRYFEQIRFNSPKVASYKSSADNEIHQLLNPTTMPFSMAGRITDEAWRNFRCEPLLSLTHLDAQELKRTTMDTPHHVGSMLQENTCDQSSELQYKYCKSVDDPCFRSDFFQSRRSVFSRLSGFPKAQVDEGFNDAESCESPTVVVTLSKALELVEQRQNKWRRKGKLKVSDGKDNYMIADAVAKVDRHITFEMDATGDCDTKESSEPNFLDFKRRSQVKKEISKNEEHGEGGGDESVGKPKRRKLLRPSFDKECASSAGDCKNENSKVLLLDSTGSKLAEEKKISLSDGCAMASVEVECDKEKI